MALLCKARCKALQSTKSAERAQRCRTNISADVMLDKATINQTPQEKFLSNENNKEHFNALLMTELEQSNIAINQAEEDVDALIVDTAKSLASQYDDAVVIILTCWLCSLDQYPLTKMFTSKNLGEVMHQTLCILQLHSNTTRLKIFYSFML